MREVQQKSTSSDLGVPFVRGEMEKVAGNVITHQRFFVKTKFYSTNCFDAEAQNIVQNIVKILVFLKTNKMSRLFLKIEIKSFSLSRYALLSRIVHNSKTFPHHIENSLCEFDFISSLPN